MAEAFEDWLRERAANELEYPFLRAWVDATADALISNTTLTHQDVEDLKTKARSALGLREA